MNAKHTPGPWSLTEPNGVGQGYSLKGPDAWFGYKPWSQETRANATLCAAAPDLLAELETAATRLEVAGFMAVKARAAIAKARGDA